MTYEVGQLIRITVDAPDDNTYIKAGDICVIKAVYEGRAYDVAAEFDHDMNGWDCDGACDFNRGWKLCVDQFEIYEDNEDIDFSESDVNKFLSFFDPAV